MMTGLRNLGLATLIGACFGMPTVADAQNCSNVKSGLGVNQKAQNASRNVVGQSLDDIQEQGHMLFAVYEDFAPYSYKKDGELVGVDIDLARLIAKDINVEARFYVTGAAESVDADMLNNIWKGRLIGGQIANVMMHIPYNRELACRNQQVVMTGQYYNERIAIAYDSMLPDSPFYDPAAARTAYGKLKDQQVGGVPVHTKALMMRDALKTFVAMEQQINDLESDNALLRQDLEKREEALKRLRELTLGQ